MQGRQICFFFILLVLACFQTNAQKVEFNDKGEKILVYPDGSWRYYQPGRDDKVDKPFTEEEEETTQGDDKTLHPPKLKKKTNSSVTRLQRDVMQYAERTAVEEMRARDEWDQAKVHATIIERERKQAQLDPNTSVDRLIEIEDNLKKAKQKVETAEDKFKAAKKKAKEASRLVNKSPSQQAKEWKKIVGREQSELGIVSVPEKKVRPAASDAGTSERLPTDRQNDLPTWRPTGKHDVMLNPPNPECQYSFEGVDEFSGKRRRDMEPEVLFRHTREQLRPYFRDKDYMVCEGYLTASSNGTKNLFLHFTIASEMAKREFGMLEKGSVVSVLFMDGTTVQLMNSRTDPGTISPVDQSVRYQGQYHISNSNEKSLSKFEVDKIRVVWGTGYEDYEVYNLDFFSDQLRCLNKG